jgi:transcriptional regulator with XRE-family HTH domain
MIPRQGGYPALGEEIRRIREERELTRAEFLRCLDQVLGNKDEAYEPLSEAWLGRLEKGKTIKIDREIIISLCTALKCTHRERVKLLLLADRNVFLETADNVTLPIQVFSHVISIIVDKTYMVLSDLIENYDSEDLSEEELSTICLEAIKIAIDDSETQEG